MKLARVLMMVSYFLLAVPLRFVTKAYFLHVVTRAEWFACQVCFVLTMWAIVQMGRSLYKAGRAAGPARDPSGEPDPPGAAR